MTKKVIEAVIVGAGHRSMGYAEYALAHPDQLRIVGVADLDPHRREAAAKRFDLPKERCFSSAEELAAQGRIADVIINGTMDAEHVPTSLPLLKLGYDMLLEKPIGTSAEDVLKLGNAAREYGNKVLICHVLRYAPFYAEVRRRIASGRLGTILNIQISEHVSYHHISSCFVRGKWNNKARCGSSTLMAKCCHDMDLLSWLKSGVRPERVSSMGGLMYFRRENAPKDAGTRCLVDCPIEKDCLYSARKLYLDHPDRWAFYVWRELEHLGEITLADKEHYLKTTSPDGRCVWKCDNDVVDHQSVVVSFEDGSTATHNLVGGTSKPCRTIHVAGTAGEIRGVMEDGCFTEYHPDTRPGHEYSEEVVELNVTNDMHGGGDCLLVEDFVAILQGREPSLSTTALEDSINGHLIGFMADASMEEKRVMEIPRY